MKLKIFLMSCVLWIMGHGIGWCSLPDRTEVMGLFYKANATYKSNDYSEALKLYQQIVDSGYASPAIYYNIGNCWIKEGKLGHALLWYERSLRLDPRDADVLANFAFAQGMIKNPEPQGKKNWGRRIFVHLSAVTQDEVIFILVVLIGVTATVILVGLFLRWKFRKSLVFILIMAVLFVFHLFALILKIELTKNQAVVLETVEVKYEPELTGTTHFTAYEGWKVLFLRESEGWVKIERTDGLRGWIPVDKLEKI